MLKFNVFRIHQIDDRMNLIEHMLYLNYTMNLLVDIRIVYD
jgi:hypothetical protein